jgi:hypothetical protein
MSSCHRRGRQQPGRKLIGREAVIVEDEDGIHIFVAATEPPRLYVDRSDRDALGGFGLQSPRTRSEAADQHLILEPALTIVVYDDSGWSAEAHVEGWVDENDDIDPQRMVARVGEQADVKFS